MGYNFELQDQHFRIQAPAVDAFYEDLVKLAQASVTHPVYKREGYVLDLAEANQLFYVDWQQRDGSIIGYEYLGTVKAWIEDSFFDCIGRYADPGGFVELLYEDGVHVKYEFTGTGAVKKTGRIVYD